MTDNEIIKALECCSIGTFACGEDCPCFHGKSNLKVSSCRFELVGEALDLINRQKAEIERLKDANEVNVSSCGTLYHRLATAKAEAIKEFAERLKEKAGVCYLENIEFLAYRITADSINNLVAEMVGDNNVNTERKGDGKSV